MKNQCGICGKVTDQRFFHLTCHNIDPTVCNIKAYFVDITNYDYDKNEGDNK